MTIRRTPEDFDVQERLTPAWLSGVRENWPAEGLSAIGLANTGPNATDETHAAYELTKTSLTTPEAVSWLAKRLGVPAGKVSYAGLKDKHARTTQVVTVPVIDAQAAARLPADLSDSRWSARRLGFANGEITAEAIEANVFTLVVRDLSKQAAAEMDRRAALLTDHVNGHSRSDRPADEPPGRSLFLINYFGAQRFGSARHKRGFAAAYLAKGNFEEALGLLIASPSRKDSPRVKAFGRMLSERWGDWKDLATQLPKCPERRAIETLASGGEFRDAFAALPYFTQQMCVEAFQSWIWNETVRRLIECLEVSVHHTNADPRTRGETESASSPGVATATVAERSARGKSLLHADDLFGKLVFAGPGVMPEAWRSLTIPMPARGVELAEPWGAHAVAALSTEGLAMDDLHIPGLRRPFFGKADRPLVVRASRFEMSEPERDESSLGKRLKRTVRFELPRGAYATVVLRALGQ